MAQPLLKDERKWILCVNMTCSSNKRCEH
jgi:hypothetical protein